jgi:flagellar biosynthesis protein FlhB
MADEDVDLESKTEEASPKRREEALKQGQMPFSQELVGAVVLLAAVVGLIWFGTSIGDAMLQFVRTDLRILLPAEPSDLTPSGVQSLLIRFAWRMIRVIAPWFGLMLLGGILASVAQAGLQFTPERLEFKLDRLNPATGAGKLFTAAALVKGGLAILKIAAMSGVAYWVFQSRIGVILGLGRTDLATATSSAWAIVTRLALYLAIGTALVSAFDYIYQRRRFEAMLRMTKQEVKDEHKEEEGDPQQKARMRQLGRERAMQKLLKEIPKATVVITNPTHYSIALRYQTGSDATPVVVAKGAGAMALRIREVARKNGVPIVERPLLARGIYRSVKEGQPIPQTLFRAVAEVIAFVYRLKGIGS